jgi:Domain of unknown function (DUF3560)
MTDITITHTHEDGTLVQGTEKGDGVYELIGPRTLARFRYFPSIRMIGIPQSRDHLAKRGQIEAARKALEAAGHAVTVEIDDTPRGVAQVKEDRAGRLAVRKDALEDAAGRNAAEADQRFARAHEIAYARNGQPRLAGHYSCRAWDADQKRIENNDRLGAVAYGKAQHYEQAAKVVGHADAYRERPEVIIRRIEKAEADLRRVQRTIKGETYSLSDKPADGWLASLEAQVAFLEHQLTADREALQAAKDAGYSCHSKETVHVGDVVRVGRGGWGSGKVVRVSAKSVSVETPYSWTDRVSYERISEVICTHGGQASA